MNDTRYGLTAGVYTPDGERAQRLLAQVNAGSLYWNCCDRVSPRLPWSGFGDSGVGLTLSTYGIQTFTRPRAWHLQSASVNSLRRAGRGPLPAGLHISLTTRPNASTLPQSVNSTSVSGSVGPLVIHMMKRITCRSQKL